MKGLPERPTLQRSEREKTTEDKASIGRWREDSGKLKNQSRSVSSDPVVVIIPGELPDMNQYTAALKRHRMIGSKMKEEASTIVRLLSSSKKGHDLKPPYFIHFHWGCKNKRKDKDNIAFAKKFILDGLQWSGVLPQDSWKTIAGFKDTFSIEKKPFIRIVITESV